MYDENLENPESGSDYSKRSQHSAIDFITKAIPILISIGALIISLFAYLDQHNTDQAAERSAEQVDAVKASFWPVYAQAPVSLNQVGLKWPMFIGEFIPLTQLGSVTDIELSKKVSRSALIADTVDEALEGKTQVIVENQANAPISSVDLLVEARDRTGRVVLGGQIIGVGTVPPCSIATVNSVQRAIFDILESFVKVGRNNGGGWWGSISNIPRIELISMTFTDGFGKRWIRMSDGTIEEYAKNRENRPLSVGYPTSETRISAAPNCQ